MGLPSVFERYHAEIDAEISDIIDERDSHLYDMLRYHLGWMDSKGKVRKRSNGKAVRPTLCLLACEAVGGDYQPALPAAAAVELVHNFSLIHDDIQDDDVERHHQPSVWRVWGKAQAINAGTVMRMLANVALRRLKVSPAKKLRIQKLIDEATIRLIEGQYLDISFESRSDISSSDYIDMVGCKTAALIACAVGSGAELGTNDRKTISSLQEFGWNLGVAFQTKDDILGIWGKKEETGKPSGNDIRRRKKTLPFILGMQRSSGHSLEQLRHNLYEPCLCEQSLRVHSSDEETMSEDSVQSIIGILENAGALEETQRITEEYIKKALNILDSISLSPSARQNLDEVVTFLKTRTF
jgi:geranylgeranyl diphosphate synthase, type I